MPRNKFISNICSKLNFNRKRSAVVLLHYAIGYTSFIPQSSMEIKRICCSLLLNMKIFPKMTSIRANEVIYSNSLLTFQSEKSTIHQEASVNAQGGGTQWSTAGVKISSHSQCSFLTSSVTRAKKCLGFYQTEQNYQLMFPHFCQHFICYEGMTHTLELSSLCPRQKV